MGGGAGNGAAPPDASKMQEMMKNPSIAKVLDNPEFIGSAVQMLKTPMAKPQLEAIAKQTGISEGTILTTLEWLVSAAYGYKRVKPALPIIKYGLIILIVAYLLKWFGVTSGLFFMMPFQ